MILNDCVQFLANNIKHKRVKFFIGVKYIAMTKNLIHVSHEIKNNPGIIKSLTNLQGIFIEIFLLLIL